MPSLHATIAKLAENFADEVLRAVMCAVRAELPWDGEVTRPVRAPQHRGSLGAADPDVVRLPLALATLERRAIAAALRATGGNRLRAAAILGVNRQTLYNKLKAYGIR